MTRSSIPWGRLAAEFVVIVVGVLVALAFDAWRQDTEEAEVGRAHVDALIADLRTDSVMMAGVVPGLERKATAIDILLRDLDEIPADSVVGLVRWSANYGWRIPNARNAAFEEMLSTGGLRLIPSPELRLRIVWYYEGWEHALERFDRHRSAYPNATYEMLPASDAIPVDTATVRSRLASPEIRDLLRHESNYAALVLREVTRLRDGADSLLVLLPTSGT